MDCISTVLPAQSMRRHERPDETRWTRAPRAIGPNASVCTASGHIDTSERAQVLTDHACGAVQLYAMPCGAMQASLTRGP